MAVQRGSNRCPPLKELLSMAGFIFYCNLESQLLYCDCYISVCACVCMCVCLLTLVSEGGGGRGRGDRGSRCRDGTLANRLLHDTPLLHFVHHIFYRDKRGRRGEEMEGEKERMCWEERGERHTGQKVNVMAVGG